MILLVIYMSIRLPHNTDQAGSDACANSYEIWMYLDLMTLTRVTDPCLPGCPVLCCRHRCGQTTKQWTYVGYSSVQFNKSGWNDLKLSLSCSNSCFTHWKEGFRPASQAWMTLSTHMIVGKITSLGAKLLKSNDCNVEGIAHRNEPTVNYHSTLWFPSALLGCCGFTACKFTVLVHRLQQQEAAFVCKGAQKTNKVDE